MSKYYSYLNTTKQIIENYNGSTPLAIYLKKFFKSSSKYGSRDRREISELAYNYYRVANVLKNENIEDKILIANYLCNKTETKILEALKPDWIESVDLSIQEKLLKIGEEFDLNAIFPFIDSLSNKIDRETFNSSFLQQPKLFIRIRPGYNKSVISKLKENNIDFVKVSESCLAFETGVKIDQYLEVGTEVIIQDFSSQKIGEILSEYLNNTPDTLKIWDCCAASGGKSIMMFDLNNQIDLTVSDIRASIIENLHERFALAGIKNYESFIADLTEEKTLIKNDFDIIIADVPCTGSGTWARTPEEKHFFRKESIEYYSTLQFDIVQKAIKNLKKSGIFIYITCSVFENENEKQVIKIVNELSLKLINEQYLIGYNDNADSMYMAILRK
jgi:16S rRNA (cytosine967-C5)-methyltransferase